jgi:hypothetical protein
VEIIKTRIIFLNKEPRVIWERSVILKPRAICQPVRTIAKGRRGVGDRQKRRMRYRALWSALIMNRVAQDAYTRHI